MCTFSLCCIMVVKEKVTYLHPVAVEWTSLVVTRIAWFYLNCIGDSLSVTIPSKVKKCWRACATLVIPLWLICSWEAHYWRDSEKYKLQSCLSKESTHGSMQLQSQPMAVWIISNSGIRFLDACKFNLTGNWLLTRKWTTKRQRPSKLPSNTQTSSNGIDTGFVKRRSITPPQDKFFMLHV